MHNCHGLPMLHRNTEELKQLQDVLGRSMNRGLFLSMPFSSRPPIFHLQYGSGDDRGWHYTGR